MDVEGRKRILILGVGNLLLKDEGVGVHVVQRLGGISLPPDVEVMDGGTGGLDLVFEMEGREKVVIIDAVKAGESPGTLYRFEGGDLEDSPKMVLSFHDIELPDALRLADFIQCKKPREIVFIGIEPKDMSAGLELSPEIEQKIPTIIDLISKEISGYH